MKDRFSPLALPTSEAEMPTMPAPKMARSSLLRERLLLLALLLLFISGSITWLLWPQVVAALSVAPRRPVPQARTITPTTTPTRASSPTDGAGTWITLVQDDFERPDQRFWGQASSGNDWGADANSNAAFAIENNAGIVSNSKSKRLYEAMIGPAIISGEIDCTLRVQLADHANVGVMLDWQNASNWVRATLNGTMLLISRMDNGHLNRLGETPFALANGASVTIRLRAEHGVLEALAWMAGTAEPSAWMLMIHNTEPASTAGLGGVIAVLKGPNVLAVTSFAETGELGSNAAQEPGRSRT